MAFSFSLNADSTVATVSHNFRTVKIDGESKKRESINFTFKPVYEFDKKINSILNESLAQYGKVLIAENADDWNYIPSDSEITLDNLYSYQSAPSERGNRLINKATLSEISDAYINFAINSGKTSQQAQTGAKVIESQFKIILGNSVALSAMRSNMDNFVNSDPQISENGLSALIRLIENLDSMLNPQITADSL